MTGKEAIKLSGRSRQWLQHRYCAWCGQSLWRTLRYGCGAIYEQCDPAKKDFSRSGLNTKSAEASS